VTQYQKARALAAAFKRLDQAQAELLKAERAVSDLVGVVAAGHSANREGVRKALVLTGLLKS